MAELDYLMDGMRPSTLARVAVLLNDLIQPGSDAAEFYALNKLAGAAYDAGIRNCGDDFIDMYIDEVESFGEDDQRAEDNATYNSIVAAGLARHVR